MSEFDPGFVSKAVKDFPNAPWTRLKCLSLRRTNRASPLDWQCTQELKGRAGNYAFLLPREDFRRSHTIELAGPGGCKIPYSFRASEQPAVPGLDDWFVVYVGKTADLAKRFQQHFAGTRLNSSNQVKRGLVDSGVAADFAGAKAIMVSRSMIIYTTVLGKGHVANRDVIEWTLCAKFVPPFNVKSEH